MPDLKPASETSNNLDVSKENLRWLASGSRRTKDPEGKTKLILFLVGALLTPVSFAGALLGYVRGYNRFMDDEEDLPLLAPLSPIMRAAMILGAVVIWLVMYLIILLFIHLVAPTLQSFYILAAYIALNLIVCVVIWNRFRSWQDGILNAQYKSDKFGTARYAKRKELGRYSGPQGIYLGGGYTLNEKGHILTVAGTRGGKGTSLIIPNLLGMGGFQGSWVVIDPKGENAVISARYQREAGQDVVILNPWGLWEENIGGAQSYNPLDILKDKSNINLIDDIQIIAEMIVPIERGTQDKFFTDNARSIVAGLLLHLAVLQPDTKSFKNNKSGANKGAVSVAALELQVIYEWVRLPKKEWEKLIGDMNCVDDKLYGNAVLQAANEIEKLMVAGDRTWGTIIAVVLQCTDFLKSPALQKSLRSGFDPGKISEGKTSLYIIIPADKLQSHARWLRLVVTTAMRAVIRNSNQPVCFLLDEFSALGYLPEVEVALSTYAGFNVTVWTILQSLVQLQAHYKDTWETFIGNSTVRHYFSVNDNFTANYVSNTVGASTYLQKSRVLGVVYKSEVSARLLLTPDEIRRGSGPNIFTFMGESPVTFYPKNPYYQMYELAGRFDPNPYFREIEQG